MRVSGRHRSFLGDKGTVVGNHLGINTAYYFLRRRHGGPGKFKTRPQQTIHAAALAFTREPRTNELTHVEQGAKKCGKEHHLGKNEPEHTEHIALVQLAAIHTGEVFPDRRSEPAGQRKNKEHQPYRQYPDRRAGLISATVGHVIQYQSGTENRQDQANSCPDRQTRRLRHVILFVTC